MSHLTYQSESSPSDVSALAATSRNTVDQPTDAVSFGRVFRSEWHKIWWLRSIGWCAGLLVVLSWGSAVVVGLSARGLGISGPEIGTVVVNAAVTGWVFMAVIMALLGTFAISSEYSSGMIRTTLSAVPQRGLLFVAKLAAVTIAALLLAVVTVWGTACIIAGFADMNSVFEILSPSVNASLLITVLTLTAMTMFGFGLGSLLRASSGAIIVLLAMLILIPMVLGPLSMLGMEWTLTAQGFFPAAFSSDAIISPLNYNTDATGMWRQLLPAIGGLLAWVLAVIIPAWVLHRTRDVK